MRRMCMLVAGALAGLVSAAAVASAQPRIPSAQASRAAVVALRSTSLGRILVSSSGRTLYEFTRDRGARNSCVSIGGCPQAWPALTGSGRPIAGAGVRASLLSSIALAGGSRQVTYAGHPLYLYSGDGAAGETSYVGVRAFGGNWYALSSAGGAVR